MDKFIPSKTLMTFTHVGRYLPAEMPNLQDKSLLKTNQTDIIIDRPLNHLNVINESFFNLTGLNGPFQLLSSCKSLRLD